MNRTIWMGTVRAVVMMVMALPVVVQVLGQGVATAATIPPSSVFDTSVTTVPDSSASKVVVATCPAGKRIVGGGAAVGGETQHIVLTRQEPVFDPSGDSYVVEATRDPTGPITIWSLTAIAFCADPPPGLEIVSSTLVTDRASEVAAASCPPGFAVVGMGGRIQDGDNQVTLATSGILPTAFVQSFNLFNRIGRPYIMTAFAVCVIPNNMTDLQVVASRSPPTPPGGQQSAEAVCPPGKGVTGGAAFAVPPVVIQSITADDSRTRIRAVGRNDGGVPGGAVQVFAFCAS